MISNEVVQDSNLSDRARFIYCYMASMPDDWVFYQANLAKSLGYSRDTLQKYMNELLSAGVLTRKQEKNGTKFANYTYELMAYKKQEPKFSATGIFRNGNFPQREFSATEKVDTNKETLEQRNIKDKETVKTNTAQSQAIDAPPPKKRNVIDWDWADRLVERFGVTEQVAKDFIIARKAKSAAITETVLDTFQKEVKKVNDAGVYFSEREAFAYWVASGWQGFKANWYLKGQQGQVKTGYKGKETIEDCMARLSKSESAGVELDVTPSKNGLGLPNFDYVDDVDPFAY
jgi:hypothetical protein